MTVQENNEFFIDSVANMLPEAFAGNALALYKHQASHCAVFKEYHELLNRNPLKATKLEDILYLPIQFFKSKEVKTGSWPYQTVYHSSGTTSTDTSKHYVYQVNHYLDHAVSAFTAQYGSLQQYHLLALVPSYLENPHSSLIAMLAHFIGQTESEYSGFFANNYKQLLDTLKILEEQNNSKKIILWGVTYALLDLLESSFDFESLSHKLIIVETGGMKGRRQEMQKTELHQVLCQGFGVDQIHSEYGMTELLSQAYSHGENIFTPAATMRVQLREVSDPYTYIANTNHSKTGAINIIDLANVYTCGFIETADLGQYYGSEGQFRILGRLDNADIRGCNLLAE
jgi:hypothetical protein